MTKHREILTNIFFEFPSHLILRGGRLQRQGIPSRLQGKAGDEELLLPETVSKVAKEEMNRKVTLVQSRSTPQGGWSSSCGVGKMEPTPDDTYSIQVEGGSTNPKL